MFTDNIYEAYKNLKVMKEHTLRIWLGEFISGYQGDNIEAISALADKIEHMCLYIGQPNCVRPMIERIVSGKQSTWGNRKVGRWGLYDVPIKTPPFIHNKARESVYDSLIKGHMRWNWGKAYTFTRSDRDYISEFFLGGKRGRKPSKKDTLSMTLNIVHHSVYKSTDVNHKIHTLYIEVVTSSGNQYRFVFYPDTQKLTWNLYPKEMNQLDRKWAMAVLKIHYPDLVTEG